MSLSRGWPSVRRVFFLNVHYFCFRKHTRLRQPHMGKAISKRIYGVTDFKDVLRKINYNRQPSLGDLIYFPAFTQEGLKVNRFVIKKFAEM